MGLPGLASQQQVDYNDGAIAVDVISDLISASYDLIGLLRDLQRSKRQREDHAQQLLHDLQRSQVFFFYLSFIFSFALFALFSYTPNLITRQIVDDRSVSQNGVSINRHMKKKKKKLQIFFYFFEHILVVTGQGEGAERSTGA